MITIVKRNFLIPYKVKVPLNITTVVVYVSDLHISRQMLCAGLCFVIHDCRVEERGWAVWAFAYSIIWIKKD